MNKDIYAILRPQEEKAFNAYVTSKHNIIVLSYNDNMAEKALKQLDNIQSLYLTKSIITLDEAMRMISEL